MAKVAIKYDNIVPYGDFFYTMNEFWRIGLSKLVVGRLDVRCANYGYQYSDIMLALFCVYLCGGDHIEDITAMLKIFYQYLLAKVSEIFPGVDMKSRLKRFVFAFIVVPAKWVRVARQWTLNIYTKDRWLHYRTIFNASYG